MGVLKVNGVNILNYTTPVTIATVGEAHTAFPSKIKGISSEVNNKTKKIITGWSLPNNENYSTNTNYDAAQGKLKINGVVAPIMIDGTRPRNISSLITFAQTGVTRYLNNVGGKLYFSTTANSATGTLLLTSKAPNKDCVVNMLIWGAGGKGGTGAWWFFYGNRGGVGGGGGGKAFATLCLRNNDYIGCRFPIDTGIEKGRITASNTETYVASSAYLDPPGGAVFYYVEGGRSGISNNTLNSTDPLTHTSGGRAYTGSYYKHPIFIVRKTAHGANKVYNGLNGGSCTFVNHTLPYWGNPEGNAGNLASTGVGGVSVANTSNTAQGSGGGGSYGAGGRSNTASVSTGAAPTSQRGGGGGGAGSPSGGADGGDGSYPGIMIYY